MSSRKRSGSGSKRPKEKVVFIYELIFRGEDPQVGFWDENNMIANCKQS